MSVTESRPFPFRRVLVTGGCGFIGSALVRCLIAEGVSVLNLDRLTYAGSAATVAAVAASPLYAFSRTDICDARAVREVLDGFRPEAILHLAAESHVDRSIDGPDAFVQTNVVGTFTLLQAALDYHRGASRDVKEAFRFLHVSTDEVYGSLDAEGAPFTESDAYRPNSPYSASKAGADHLVRAWGRTYGLPVLISNCSNNYGPFQFPEKMIPTMILAGLAGTEMPVYGKGENMRDWLYVEDHVSALLAILARGRILETYLVGGGEELRNIDLVYRICDLLDQVRPGASESRRNLIRFVEDRPGHDLRYAIASDKIRSELGWMPKENFTSGLMRTLCWYIDNEDWCRALQTRGTGGNARLGLARALERESAVSS